MEDEKPAEGQGCLEGAHSCPWPSEPWPSSGQSCLCAATRAPRLTSKGQGCEGGSAQGGGTWGRTSGAEGEQERWAQPGLSGLAGVFLGHGVRVCMQGQPWQGSRKKQEGGRRGARQWGQRSGDRSWALLPLRAVSLGP